MILGFLYIIEIYHNLNIFPVMWIHHRQNAFFGWGGVLGFELRTSCESHLQSILLWLFGEGFFFKLFA
jgi:hypothetical protein